MIRTKILKTINRLLAMCLSALGLAGCQTEKYGCPPVECEYGTPYATFVAEGNVADEETNGGIEGVSIIVREHESIPVSTSYISTKTLADGTYRTDDGTTIFPVDSVWIHAIDNTGVYAEDSTKVKVDYVSKGDGRWNYGEGEAKADFALKKK